MSNTATSMCFSIDVRNSGQNPGATTQPSMSTQIDGSFATVLDRRDRATTDGTGDRKDDVGAVVEQGLGRVPTLVLVLEVTGEETVLFLRSHPSSSTLPPFCSL